MYLLYPNGWAFHYGKPEALGYLARALAETGDWVGVAAVTGHVAARTEAGDVWTKGMDPGVEGGIKALAAIAKIVTGADPQAGSREIDELVAHPDLGIGWDAMALAYVAADRREDLEPLLKEFAEQENADSIGIYRVARAYALHIDGDYSGAERELDHAIASLLRPQTYGDLAVAMARLVKERIEASE